MILSSRQSPSGCALVAALAAGSSINSSQLALPVSMGLCALGVTVGYRTPMSTMLLLVFTLTLHNGNPLIMNGGDRQLATALLWVCLLPVGRV